MPQGMGAEKSHRSDFPKSVKPHHRAANDSKTDKSPLTLSSLCVEDNDELTADAKVNGLNAFASFDSGASHLFMSEKSAITCGVQIERLTGVTLTLGNDSQIPVDGRINVSVDVDGTLSEECIYIVPMEPHDARPRLVIGRSWLRKHKAKVDWEDDTIRVTRSDGSRAIIRSKNYHEGKTVAIKQISLKRMCTLIKKKGHELYVVRAHPKIGSLNVHSDLETLVDEFKEVFRDELPETLPPKRDVEFEINLKSNEPPPVRPVIRLSTNELAELKKQLQLLLNKGLIRPSSSPYGAPVFFVKKKSGDLRMVCDYRALNKITIQDSNPLPLITEALDQVAGARIFSKIDLLGAYHQMRIRE